MKLSDIGEFGLIHRIAPLFLKNVPANIRGIGDDCAVLPYEGEDLLLITTDMLLEDIHFIRDKTSASDLGHKSLAVNLSDIAAMGGIPTAAFLSVALPKDISMAWLDEYFDGIHSLCRESETPLLGGDTTKSKKDVVINIAVLGRVHPDRVKYRSTAQAGDVICVTGTLGDSGGGLHIMLNNLEDTTDSHVQQLLQAHHRPIPHLNEGKWLSEERGVRAMMDVSDGIDSDIKRIMEESKVGARVNIQDIPVSNSLEIVCSEHDWDAKEIAASSGEDYCLLCTVDPDAYHDVATRFKEYFGKPLYKIGAIETTDKLEYYEGGQPFVFTKHGWDHFK